MGCLFEMITLPFRAVYYLFKAIWEIGEFFDHRSHRRHKRVAKPVRARTAKRIAPPRTIKKSIADPLVIRNNEPITFELLFKAVDLVVQSQQASVSYLQRKLHIDYRKAAALIDHMEQLQVIGLFENSNPREVLLTPERWNEKRKSLESP